MTQKYLWVDEETHKMVKTKSAIAGETMKEFVSRIVRQA